MPTQNVRGQIASLEAAEVLVRRDVERERAHQAAAEQRHDVGEEGEQRQRDHQREQARQDQHLERIEAERPQRVDLLVDLHHADLAR